MKRDKALNVRDPPNSWGDMLINSGIMAAIDFFTTLAGIGALGLIQDPTLSLTAAGISGALSFFVTLGMQRGLVKKPEQS